jgi:hypothetical protein
MSGTATAIARALAVACVVGAAPAGADDFPCDPAVAMLLNQHGLQLDSLSGVQAQPYSWSNDAVAEVSGWRFSGIPPQCRDATAGNVVISLWATCSVTDIYTTGNCRIPGIRQGWF